MNKLVFIEKKDLLTNSKIIAEGTGYEHHTITRKIRNHKTRFEKLGKIRFMDVTSINPNGGRPTKIYLLNEEQAVFLITLLENNDIVADFKLVLVQEFFKMKNLLQEINTESWKQFRLTSKETRKQFADVLQELVEYAKKQGSKNAKRYYQTYTKLINKKLGIESRDLATKKQLDNIAKWEELISYWIEFYMNEGIKYKEIYINIKKIVEYILDIEPFYDEKTLKVLD